MRSLRAILLLGYVSTILLTSLSIWFIVAQSREQVHQEYTVQLQDELLRRVNDAIVDLFAPARQIALTQPTLFALGGYDVGDLEIVNTLFVKGLEAFPQLNAVFLGTVDGRMYGARREAGGVAPELMRTDETTGGALSYFALPPDGSANYGALVQSAPNFDPRTRDWYIRAERAGQFAWSPVYVDFATRELIITAGIPVYDRDRELQGVLGASYKFREIDDMLAAIDVRYGGVVYLMESSGYLLSSSTGIPIYEHDSDGGIVRTAATESGVPLIESSAAHLLRRIQQESTEVISAPTPWETDDGLFIHALPLEREIGLDVWSVTVVSRAALQAAMAGSNAMTLLAVLLILAAAITLSIWGAARLVRAIRYLAGAASDLAAGRWDTNLDIQSRTEFGELYLALRNMRDQLRRLFEEREQNETKLRRGLVEREVLLRELHHRTKNNMAVIYSLIELQVDSVRDPQAKAALLSAQNRIQSILLVHKKLYEGADLARVKLQSYVQDLAELLVESYATGAARADLHISVDDIEVDIDTAIPCGLVLNEIVANSLKYASNGPAPCKIKIELKGTPEGLIRLTVSDNGPGLPAGFDLSRATTLGLITIRSIAEQQLKARVEMVSRPGLKWNIEFKPGLAAGRQSERAGAD